MPSFVSGQVTPTGLGAIVCNPGGQVNNGDTVAVLEVSGTFGTAVGVWQGSVDGVHFQNIAALRLDTIAIEQTPTLTDNTTAQWKADITGMQKVQFLPTSLVSGAMNVFIQTAPGTIPNYLLQAGSQTFIGTVVVQNSSPTAFVVGPSGATNPTLKVVSGASNATGISIAGAAAGSGASITVISSGTNESMTLDAKGSGIVTIASVSTGGVSIGNKLVVAGTLTAGGLLTNSIQIATSGPLIYSGSGVPTISAAVKGSLYLRTDGSSTTTRAYIASDAAGTWTALTTAA